MKQKSNTIKASPISPGSSGGYGRTARDRFPRLFDGSNTGLKMDGGVDISPSIANYGKFAGEGLQKIGSMVDEATKREPLQIGQDSGGGRSSAPSNVEFGRGPKKSEALDKLRSGKGY